MLNSGTAITAENRAAWLDERRSFLGASEAYDVALGDRLRVFLRKTGRMEDPPPTLAMRVGLALEPLLAARFEEEGLGRVARAQVFHRDPAMPYLAATVDGELADGGLLELKYTSVRHRLGDDGSADVPDRWMLQAQQQMAVTGRDRVDFGVLAAGEFRWFRVARHAALIDSLRAAAEKFWTGHVLPDVPPELGDASGERLRALWPHAEGWTRLGPPALATAAAYVEARRLERGHAADARRHRARLIAALGEHAEGHLDDGTVVRRVTVRSRQQARPARDVESLRLYVVPPRD